MADIHRGIKDMSVRVSVVVIEEARRVVLFKGCPVERNATRDGSIHVHSPETAFVRNRHEALRDVLIRLLQRTERSAGEVLLPRRGWRWLALGTGRFDDPAGYKISSDVRSVIPAVRNGVPLPKRRSDRHVMRSVRYAVPVAAIRGDCDVEVLRRKGANRMVRIRVHELVPCGPDGFERRSCNRQNTFRLVDDGKSAVRGRGFNGVDFFLSRYAVCGDFCSSTDTSDCI